MLISVALALLAVPAPEAPVIPGPAPALRAVKDKVCVPARDAAGRPTGAVICRTAAQWESFLRDHGYLELTALPQQTANSFALPDQLYKPHR